MRRYKILRPAHKCQAPIEAIELAEDIQLIDLMASCSKRLNPKSVSDDRENGNKQLWSVRETLRLWHQHAKDRLRKEFLAIEKN